MKHLNILKQFAFLFALCFVLTLVSSCSGGKHSEETETIASTMSVEDEDLLEESGAEEYADTNADCDLFLADYEAYVEEYIALAEKVQRNPTDMSVMSDYSAMAMKAQNWATTIQSCQNDPDFLQKYTKLSTSLATRLASAQQN